MADQPGAAPAAYQPRLERVEQAHQQEITRRRAHPRSETSGAYRVPCRT
jgi:hypothetical protein